MLRCCSTRSRIVLLHAGRRSSTLRCFGLAFYIRGAPLLLDLLSHRVTTCWAQIFDTSLVWISFLHSEVLCCCSTRSRIALLHAGRRSSILRCFVYSFLYWGCSAVARLAHASYCYMLGVDLRSFVVLDIAFYIRGALLLLDSLAHRIATSWAQIIDPSLFCI